MVANSSAENTPKAPELSIPAQKNLEFNEECTIIKHIADYYADRQEYICRGIKKSGSQWECLLCHTFYKSRQKAFNHIEAKHMKVAVHTCDTCGRQCPTKNALYAHKSRTHK